MVLREWKFGKALHEDGAYCIMYHRIITRKGSPVLISVSRLEPKALFSGAGYEGVKTRKCRVRTCGIMHNVSSQQGSASPVHIIPGTWYPGTYLCMSSLTAKEAYRKSSILPRQTDAPLTDNSHHRQQRATQATATTDSSLPHRQQHATARGTTAPTCICT